MENSLNVNNSRVFVPCVLPGFTPCDHRCVATGRPSENVMRVEVWCMCWRENHSKDKVFHHCEKEFKVG
jgi:hypothetical protein